LKDVTTILELGLKLGKEIMNFFYEIQLVFIRIYLLLSISPFSNRPILFRCQKNHNTGSVVTKDYKWKNCALSRHTLF